MKTEKQLKEMRRKDRASFTHIEEEMAKELERHGYEYVDTANVCEMGLVHAFFKEANGVRLTFDFRTVNQGGPSFIIGDLVAFFNYYPGARWMEPVGVFQIQNITLERLPVLLELESRLVAAVQTQTPIEPQERYEMDSEET